MEHDIKTILWKLIEREAKIIEEKYPSSFKFNENSEYIFYEAFENYVNDIKTKFMQEDVVELDSHKMAAIIICSIINANVLKVIYAYEEDKLFDGNEKIAVNIGLSYMRTAMIELLKGTQEAAKFTNYIMPKALMCDTEYFSILCRNLYYAKTYYKLNPIDLANTLFLIENYSLMKQEVDLELVRQKCQEFVSKPLKDTH